MKKFFMFLTVFAFTCGIAGAETAAKATAVQCDKAKMDSLKMERSALINEGKTTTDAAKKKEFHKRIAELNKGIRQLGKACKIEKMQLKAAGGKKEPPRSNKVGVQY